MDIGRDSSYQGYPIQVCWTPATPASPDFLNPKINCENGPENRFNEAATVGIYDSFLMDNLWNNIPCSDLLALADVATATKATGAGCGGIVDGGGCGGGIGGGGDNTQFQNQDGGSSFVPDSQQYGQPGQTRYLFDLNSLPTITEPPQMITSVVSPQLTPVTPKQTRRARRERVVSDIMNSSNTDKRTGQSQDAIWQLDLNEDFEEESSDELHKKTPQPKQRRKKHRPKVVIEGQPKSSKKSTPLKPDGSSTGKRKNVKKIVVEETDPTPVRQTRNSCRRKINFEDESTNELTRLKSQPVINPITPNKFEIRKDAKNTYSRAKRNINFSQNDEESYQSLEVYLSMLTNFPAIYKRKRTKRCRDSVNNNQKSYKNVLAFGQMETFRKTRSKCVKRVRDMSSLAGIIEGKQLPAQHRGSVCMESLAADFNVNISRKKRTKRNFIVPSSSYLNHRVLTNHIGFDSSFRWKSTYDVNALINQFENLGIENRTVQEDRHEIVPYLTRYQEKYGIVLYKQDSRSIVPFEGYDNSVKIRKPRPKVDLDDETSRVWRLLLEDINSQGIDGTDEDMSKWWEEERNVFSGRATSFIARMHLVQGDRRFSQWKGSVVDSVIGVFLTQNVSDHLSSSAFMSLAAKYPLKSKSKSKISNEPLQDDNKSSISVKEPLQFDLEETIIWHEEVVNSNEVCEINKLESIYNSNEQNEVISHYHRTSEHGIIPHKDTVEYIDLSEDIIVMHKKQEDKCVSEQSGISAESASPATVDLVKPKSCNVEKAPGTENFSAEISEVIESNSNKHGKIQATGSGVKKGKMGKRKKKKADWDSLRKNAKVKEKRERTPNTMDSLDYEAVRCADVNEIADTIKDRGMNNMLAERIKEFLNRLVKDHGSIDLEWLRDVPPDKVKEYLLSFRGLGLKSVECVRLLTLQHLAFPVDTNVGRIAVRLGWVPLQPLPESLQLHLLEMYPILESIQQYLWPRLCKLDQRTLYELHYQMITFGKVFCTKNKPNCNACPMRGECRHFASAFASARLALPAPEEKSIVLTTENKTHSQSPNGLTSQNPNGLTSQYHLTLPPPNHYLQQKAETKNSDPVIEEPTTPEPIIEVPATPEPEKIQQEYDDIEDFSDDCEEIPMIKLNMEEFSHNLQNYMENNMELAEGDMSRALVALTSEAASIPTPKLKNVSQLRTEHQVYELPDSHPLLEGLDKREPDDPCSYLLAIWTPGETAESIQPPRGHCSSQESGTLCYKQTCFLCNSIREANSQTVRGTLLIPCRTAMRGSFPLNGTYFQVNEVFADHDSSLNPIDVPRSWLWNLPRRTVFFGTSIPTIFKGLTTEGIQYCFWRGFVCVRGFDQKTRAPRPLMARLHFPASKLKRSKGKIDED